MDEFFNFFENNKPANFLARVSFQDKALGGVTQSVDIPISLESHTKTLTYVNELRRTEFELQKIPKLLEGIEKQLTDLVNIQKGQKQ